MQVRISVRPETAGCRPVSATGVPWTGDRRRAVAASSGVCDARGRGVVWVKMSAWRSRPTPTEQTRRRRPLMRDVAIYHDGMPS